MLYFNIFNGNPLYILWPKLLLLSIYTKFLTEISTVCSRSCYSLAVIPKLTLESWSSKKKKEITTTLKFSPQKWLLWEFRGLNLPSIYYLVGWWQKVTKKSTMASSLWVGDQKWHKNPQSRSKGLPKFYMFQFLKKKKTLRMTKITITTCLLVGDKKWQKN